MSRFAFVVLVGALFVASVALWSAGYVNSLVPLVIFGVLLFGFFVEQSRYRTEVRRRLDELSAMVEERPAAHA